MLSQKQGGGRAPSVLFAFNARADSVDAALSLRVYKFVAPLTQSQNSPEREIILQFSLKRSALLIFVSSPEKHSNLGARTRVSLRF